MEAAQLKGVKTYLGMWQAPNLTKAGLAGLIGFSSLRLEPVPNTTPYKKHPLLALAQTWTSHDVNPTWDKWFKRPLKQQDINAEKRHKTKRTVMKQADISGLNFKYKNLKHFDLTKAKAHLTDLSQAYVGLVPMDKYIEKILSTNNSQLQQNLVKRLKTYLPKISKTSLPVIAKKQESQHRLLKLLGIKGEKI
jgi:hypothetical protein